MIIQPCHRCHLRDTCDLRKAKLLATRGLGITSIKIRCDILKQAITPGRLVRVNLLYVASGSDSGGIVTERKTVDAVIMGWDGIGKKVRIYVPYEDEGDWWLEGLLRHDSTERKVHVLRVYASQLEMGTVIVSVCHKCGLPDGVVIPDWTCGEGGCLGVTEGPKLLSLQEQSA